MFEKKYKNLKFKTRSSPNGLILDNKKMQTKLADNFNINFMNRNKAMIRHFLNEIIQF